MKGYCGWLTPCSISPGWSQAKRQPTLERVDLGRYTAELASMFRAATERAGLRLDVDCEALDVDTFIDREMWAKIISNLLSNALEVHF